MTTKSNSANNAAFKFFYANAGYSYDPKTQAPAQGKAKCARSLAAAERKASALGWTFDWVFDDQPCMGCECGSESCDCFTGEPHETFGCVLRDENGESLESLWGICKPTREYRRVVEAELASEALAYRKAA
jgi:hypothetical protein